VKTSLNLPAAATELLRSFDRDPPKVRLAALTRILLLLSLVRALRAAVAVAALITGGSSLLTHYGPLVGKAFTG